MYFGLGKAITHMEGGGGGGGEVNFHQPSISTEFLLGRGGGGGGGLNFYKVVCSLSCRVPSLAVATLRMSRNPFGIS